MWWQWHIPFWPHVGSRVGLLPDRSPFSIKTHCEPCSSWESLHLNEECVYTANSSSAHVTTTTIRGDIFNKVGNCGPLITQKICKQHYCPVGWKGRRGCFKIKSHYSNFIVFFFFLLGKCCKRMFHTWVQKTVHTKAKVKINKELKE